MSERKAIFITGGGSGIGRAIAQHFGNRGWFVGLGDIDRLGMEATQDGLPRGFSYIHEFDVRNRPAWDEALATFSRATGGRIDVLVNNAGIPIGGPLAEHSQDEIDRCLDINLKGVLYGAQAAFPHLKEAAPGSCLLNIASAAGIYGSGGMSVYCATKFGVRGVTESLDAEWAEHGIKVCDLMPSFIDTPLLDKLPNAHTNEAVRDQVTQAGLEITPVEEVAKAAWDAVHGNDLHTVVGKTAKSLRFAARWMPGRLRKMSRQSPRVMGR